MEKGCTARWPPSHCQDPHRKRSGVSMNSKENLATVREMDSRTKMRVTGLIQIFRSIGKDGLGVEECLVLKRTYPNSGQSNQKAKGPHPRFSS
jgi:hypothetical protein